MRYVTVNGVRVWPASPPADCCQCPHCRPRRLTRLVYWWRWTTEGDGTMRMTEKRRQAEAAVAATAMAEAEKDTAGKRARIRRLEGSINSVTASAQCWDEADMLVASATAWGIVAKLQGRLRELDPKNALLR